MSALSSIKRRLEELSEELSNELNDAYSVILELYITSSNGNCEQKIKIDIIEYDTYVVNSSTVKVDVHASMTDTLAYVKNKFRLTSKFDKYRKNRTFTIDEIIKKLENEDGQTVWFCKKNSCLCALTICGNLKFYRLNGKAEYSKDEYENEIRKNLLNTTPVDFLISEYYEEFKDYIRKFNPEISIWEHNYDDDPMDEGDDFHFNVDKGCGALSELDVKSFESLYGFLNWLAIRKEMKK